MTPKPFYKQHKTCDKCGRSISKPNITKHEKACVGILPSIPQKRIQRPEPDWKEVQTFYDDKHTFMDVCKKYKMSTFKLSNFIREGKFKTRTTSETFNLRKSWAGAALWTKEQHSANAKARGFGGYRANAGHSKKFKVTDSFGVDVTLQSTYELRFANLLNEMGIKWVRPKGLKYQSRWYFADFFLPDYNIYFDTKNSYLYKKDATKIESVIKENGVSLIMVREEEITSQFIQNNLPISYMAV